MAMSKITAYTHLPPSKGLKYWTDIPRHVSLQYSLPDEDGYYTVTIRWDRDSVGSDIPTRERIIDFLEEIECEPPKRKDTAFGFGQR